ncbi:beta-1,6-N-acetylglucosaminyltransferase [Lederbergia citrea]|uniref:beta-1,6-N-acetylglucosaminyltransferase n=1 Tax=Lederbergia citrea TaxID=2833581 RepID=UPI001BC8D996|nr:beta-1,6-N-acetylglucosaminyltransferase [Lederbergia citrea]MBS4179132.1 hypothetical protein [Lederbergia citrea]
MNTTPRTAYILQIHKNSEQVNKFINQLIADDLADVYIHIDKRSYNQLHAKIIPSPNVKILQQRIVCEWGDISQIDTTLLLIKEVLASKNNYDFICLRSGQDLLVKNNFKDFLLENKSKIFMTLRKVSRGNKGLMEINFPKFARKRYTSVHPARIYRSVLQSLYRRGINISPNANQLPKEYSLYNGAQWFSIPIEVARYIIEFLDRNEWYYKYFANTLCPDEWFFQTLIMNSPYKVDLINNNLMFVKWGDTLSTRNSPQDLTYKDIQLIEESSYFFARKFNEKVDKLVIDYFAGKVTFDSSKLAKEFLI